MKPLNFPLIKLTVCFLVGVVLGFYISIPYGLLLFLLGTSFFIFFLAYLLVRKQLFQSIYFGAISFLLVFFLGIFVTKFHSPKNQADHYINHITIENQELENRRLFVGKVVKILNPSRYSDKYLLNLNRIDEQRVEGKILLNVEKDSLRQNLNIDEVVVLKSKLVPIHGPRNPHQFNYSEFMKNRGVFRQVYASPKELLVFENHHTSLLGYAENIRNKIVFSLQENGLSHSQLAMVQALFLGQTQDITDTVYDHYAAAGVIHILSVSGLHVGFVLLILNFILKPLERFRFGKFFKVILLIVLLWGFALLAGFSSPVVRSVSMFSFVAIGLNWERKTHILNILCMSLFAILLFAPRFIFEIGFQLSYLAVFTIVIFQPLFYKLYSPWTWLDKALWGTLTVTFAAQIGVVPLSLYYFHQFPGLFFLSNLLVVPYVGFLLALGMGVIFLAFLNFLPRILADFFGNCIDLLNLFVAWCAEQEAFLFQNIHFSVWEMLASYVLVFCLILLVWNFSYKKLIACGISILLLLGVFIFEKKRILQSKQFLIFHKSRKTILGFKQGDHLSLSHNLQKQNISEEYSVRNFGIGEGIEKISSDSLRNIYKVKNAYLLIVDSLGIYKFPKLKNSLVLLRNSPQVNLKRLIEQLHPRVVIVDGSNYYSYVDRWRETCERKEIPFHYTGKKGAFMVEY